MIAFSAVAVPPSVCVISIGASDPTSILIFVMRFRSWAILNDSFFTSRFWRAYTRSQYACSTELTTDCALRTKSWYDESRVLRAMRISQVVVRGPKFRSNGWFIESNRPLEEGGLTMLNEEVF